MNLLDRVCWDIEMRNDFSPGTSDEEKDRIVAYKINQMTPLELLTAISKVLEGDKGTIK